MPLRDVFLHADSGADFKSRLEATVNLAARHRAHLTAVYVPDLPKEARTRRAPHPAVPDLVATAARAPGLKSRAELRVANAYERVRETSERVKELFVRQAERAGVAHHWVYEEGELVDALSLHARFCDVLVITQPTERDRSRELVTLGLPILMVPKKKAGAARVGERILIAWDRSPVALRAVNNARPFLREAAEVKVLSVNLEPIYRGATDGSGIIEHLSRHDIKATRVRVSNGDARLSDVILETAAKEHSDLIVMGAFGRRGLRERMLGGVTSHVISDASVALLLSH